MSPKLISCLFLPFFFFFFLLSFPFPLFHLQRKMWAEDNQRNKAESEESGKRQSWQKPVDEKEEEQEQQKEEETRRDAIIGNCQTRQICIALHSTHRHRQTHTYTVIYIAYYILYRERLEASSWMSRTW